MRRKLRMRGVHRQILLALLAVFIAEAAGKPPAFVVRRPTIVAFFPPVKQAELDDPDTNEALSDFQVYATRVREPLRKAGIDFHEVYAVSLRLRSGNKVITFRPGDSKGGYYFVSPGKKPRVEYGVATDADIFQIALEYFGIEVK